MVAGCAPIRPAEGDVYRPFAEDHLAVPLARLSSHRRIVEQAAAATPADAPAVFAAIRADYDAYDLSDAVAGCVDAHGSDGSPIGARLDGQLSRAITAGGAAQDAIAIERAAGILDHALLVYFSTEVYAELAAETPEALDAAFGTTGLGLDGLPINGLAAVAAGREAEYGASIVEPEFGALLGGRDALAAPAEGPDGFAAYRDEVERQLLRTIAYHTRHEIDEAWETPDLRLLHARTIWQGIDGYAAIAAPSAAAAAIGAMWPTGRPDLDDDALLTIDLDAVRVGAIPFDDAALAQAIDDLLATLE